jgi:hypothetical protein
VTPSDPHTNGPYVFHVAVAKLLRAKAFVSFERRQRPLAAAVGLTVES